jgi:hypothetical protein
MRLPTMFLAPPPAPIDHAALAAVEAAIAEPQPATKSKPMQFWSIFGIGWVCGLFVGLGAR